MSNYKYFATGKNGGIAKFQYKNLDTSSYTTSSGPEAYVDVNYSFGGADFKGFQFASAAYGYPIHVEVHDPRLSWVPEYDLNESDLPWRAPPILDGTVTLIFTAHQKTPHVLRIYFDDKVLSIKFSNGDTVTYDARAPYQTYNYYEDVVISAGDTQWKAGWSQFTGQVYWDTTSGGTGHSIGVFTYGSLTSAGTVANRTIPFDSTTPKSIYIGGSGKAYHTVKFNPNGGSINGHTEEYTAAASYEAGTNYVLPIKSQTVAPSGKELYGFRIGSATEGTVYTPGSSVKINGNYTFWAVWTDIVYNYELTFDPNGGHWTDFSTDPKKYKTDTSETSISVRVVDPYIPSRTGYTFLGYGWTTSQTSNLYGPDSNIPLNSSAPVRTVYAIWKVNSYTLTLDGNGGYFGLLPSRNITAEYGETIHLSQNKPTRTGFTLLGWNPSSAATEPIHGPDDDYTMIYTNLTWYAVWKKKTIDLLYWDGNTGATDGTIIAIGKPFSNLKAERWNALNAKIKQINPSYSYGEVTAHISKMTAERFNDARAGILTLAGHGSLPSSVSIGSGIKASQFQAAVGCLKTALNDAITYYNTH